MNTPVPAQSIPNHNAGDIEGARRASENAKIWCWVATALAIVGVLWSAWWFTTGGMAAFMEQMQMMQNMQ
jgi:hypothetical protein